MANQSLETLFNQKAKLKRSTYLNAAEQRRASFNAFSATCDAVLDNNAESYIKRLASHLSNKWNTNLSRGTGWLHARLQICIIRSVSLCLRGSRTKWREAGLED